MLKNEIRWIILMLCIMVLVSGNLAQASSHEDSDINNIITQPVIERDGETVWDLGDCFLRNFRSSDWGKYTFENYGELIGFKGTAVTPSGNIPCEFYMQQDGSLKVFVFYGQNKDPQMGSQLIMRYMKQDIIDYNNGKQLR